MRLRESLVSLESSWFDLINRTETGAMHSFTGTEENGFGYIPTRPSVAKKIFRALPIIDFEKFTFVDVGCGKGRMLHLAANYRFHSIVGIERDSDLCAIAASNIKTLRDNRITIQKADAREYAFPDESLVLYLFNPFGEEILEAFLSNLEVSLRAYPRSVFIVLLYPEYAYVLERFQRFKLVSEVQKCRIYDGTQKIA